LISVRSEVQILPGPPFRCQRSAVSLEGGGVAQLGERLLCKQEVSGSIPLTSTRFRSARKTRAGDLRWIGRSNGLRRRLASQAPVFDMVKREYPKRQTPDNCPRGGGFGRMKSVFTRDSFVAGLRPASDGFCDQAQREGHLVDALALRGDEGRSTLR
jgi:hypothetical protein